MAKYVTYYRVSTRKQGASGLGLEAQQEAVKRFLRGGDEVVATFTEVESGRRKNRPQLAAAMLHCRAVDATLLIAKLDRLARNVAFVATLMEDKQLRFVATDNPHAEPLMLHVLAAFAEHEAKMISTRTREALAAAKARGVKLGGDRGYKPDNVAIKARALEDAKRVRPAIDDLRSRGVTSLHGIKRELNRLGLTTARGKSWSATQVDRVLKRIDRLAQVHQAPASG
jgi:DNA invertase Pin-like site-specific DNA recombinase